MTRKSLPGRRPHELLTFDHGPIVYTASASFDVDTGQVTEVFLSGGKPGGELEAMARDCAVVTSLALQYGVPLDTISSALTRLDDGSAAGPLGAMLDRLVTA